MEKREVSMTCPNCGQRRTRRYSLKRKVKISRVKCRACGRFAPWFRWKFENPTGLPLR